MFIASPLGQLPAALSGGFSFGDVVFGAVVESSTERRHLLVRHHPAHVASLGTSFALGCTCSPLEVWANFGSTFRFGGNLLPELGVALQRLTVSFATVFACA